jgi:uncharacterized RDD family membrane protein YckC
MRKRLIAGTGTLLLSICTAAAFGQEWRAARLWTTGSEKSVWVVGASQKEAGGFPVIQMWYAGPEDDLGQPKQSRWLTAVSGDIQEAAADAGALHVLFSDLTTRAYFGNRDSQAGARWRDQSDKPPLAWGGDSTGATLWALVETEALKPPSTQTTTRKDEPASEAQSPAEASRLTLLQMRDDVWQRLSTPAAADEGSQFWVTGKQGRPWLFWSVSGRGVYTASLAEEAAASTSRPASPQAWSKPEVVLTGDDPQRGWAGMWKGGPVFVAGRGPAKGRVQLHLYLRENGIWAAKGPAREGMEFLEIDPDISAVGLAADRLCTARLGEKGQIEFGVGDLGVSPSIRFTTLALRSEPSAEVPSWQGTIMLALMLGLLTVVMWSRREQIARPIVLPPGLIFAPVWRRLFATMVDALPAGIIAFLLAILIVPPASWPTDPSTVQEFANDPQMQMRLFPVWYAFALLYGVWCLVWELTIATTPGKLLFGLRVMGTQMARPLPRQIVWRNALRVIEVGLGQPGWIVTLMMLVLVSRNRQRLGDILGGTIVVMRGLAQPQPQDNGDDQP